MEQVTQAVNDELVASLDYKLQAGNTNYIQSRKSVQFFPSSLSTFTPSTSRVCRIPITPGIDFIDPQVGPPIFVLQKAVHEARPPVVVHVFDPLPVGEELDALDEAAGVRRAAEHVGGAVRVPEGEGELHALHWEGLPVDAGGRCSPGRSGTC